MDITPHCINATERGRTKFNHWSCHVTSRRVVTYSVNFSGLCVPCIVCPTNCVLTGPPLRSVSSFSLSLVVYLIESVVRLLHNKSSSLDPVGFAASLRVCDHEECFPTFLRWRNPYSRKGLQANKQRGC